MLVKKAIPVYFSLPGSKEVCLFYLGAHTQICQQKKILELKQKIPGDKQEWMITNQEGSNVILKEQATLESYKINEDIIIRVAKKLILYLCIAETPIEMKDILSTDQIIKAKKIIEKKIEIPQKEQRWLYKDQEMMDDKFFEEYLAENEDCLPIDVESTIDLEYFGFNEVSPINPDLFTNFYLESDQELTQIIDQTDYCSKINDSKFRNQILPIFFAVLKKHSLWQHLIKDIKYRVFEKKEVNLWKGNYFNTEYLLSYILNTKTSKLNVEILSLIKNHIPIPLIFRTWKKRYEPEKTEMLEDIYWLIQPSFTITSVGFGKEKIKGKSSLNNLVFFTNFLQESQRNFVCDGSTEMKFDIYKNDKVLVNFVEIADDTDELTKYKILKSSNLIVVHAGLSDHKLLYESIQSMRADETIPVIIFHRDVNNAFESTTTFQKNIEKNFEETEDSNIFEIEVENLSNHYKPEDSNEIQKIYKLVHKFVLQNFKKSSTEDLWRFINFFDGYNIKTLKTNFISIEKCSSSLCNAVKSFSEYTHIQRDQDLDNDLKQEKSQLLIKDLQEKGLTPELNELISFIYSSQFKEDHKCTESPSLILTKLQHFLRNMKIKQTMDFYKLYTFRSDLCIKEKTDTEEISKEFNKFWNELKDKTCHFKEFEFPSNISVDQVLKFITKCIEVFEQKIVPEIFSMELLWREMIYMTDLIPNFELPFVSPEGQRKAKLEQILIDLSKSRIQDGFPFEIIDGDLLHMPKTFLKSVFSGFTDTAVVISVLGPQSSGKSTLLNFLFGCDFSTSAGRCTKGIYGTFLKLSNFNACGGVLLLDTEGLFGLLNKNESEQRDKFDRKLVLFCLAISDFVLVNFRGDIDKTLSDLLMVSLEDSLVKLQQGNTIPPEMMLILNQNAQTSKEFHLRDANQLAKYGFSDNNIFVLPLAFDTKETKLEGLPDPIIRKEPKSDFSEKCRDLTNKIFERVNTKQIRQRTLEEIFDMMEKIWATMNSFPGLLKHGTLKDRDLEEKMKNWIHENVDTKWGKQLNEQLLIYKSESKAELGWEEDFEKKINNQENQIKEEFKRAFEKVSENNASLYSEHENYFHKHLNLVKREIHFEINKEIHKKKIRICQIEGEEHIKQAIKEAKNSPDMSEEEKQNLFETTWSKIESERYYTFKRKKEAQNLFKIVCEKYQTSLINLTGGLPDQGLSDLDFDIAYAKYNEIMINKLIKMYSDGGLQEAKVAPSQVLNGGIGNVSFKFFDMRNYFYQANDTELIVISRDNLHKIIDLEQIRSKTDLLFAVMLEDPISSVTQEINRTFEKFGFSLDQDSLKRYLEYKTRGWFGRQFRFEPGIPRCFGFPDTNSSINSDPYVDVTALNKAISEYRHYNRSTLRNFIKIAVRCLKVEDIKDLLNNVKEKSYQSEKIEEIIDDINEDLQKINCCLKTDQSKFYHFISSNSLGNCVQDFFTIDKSLEIDLQHLTRKHFTYIRSTQLNECLVKIKSNDYSKYSHLLLGKTISRNHHVKPQYLKIAWLKYYAKNDFKAMMDTFSKNKDLFRFVSQEFNFKKLLQEIFNCCLAHVSKSSQESLNSMSLYQKISSDVNNLIGLANNDLQQACYNLDYCISANIHLSVVHLIWKFFEEANWNRINQPLTEMRAQKEKQKRFFMAMTSEDKIKIANAEVDNFNEKLIKQWKDHVVAQIKANLIKNFADNFNKEGKREKVQEEIDAKYFSRGAQVNPEELYNYICEPYEILESHYKILFDKYTSNLNSEFIRKAQDKKLLLESLRERIISVYGILNTYSDSSFDHYNLYQPKQYNNSSPNEVIYSTYEDQLRKVNLEILISLLEGDPTILNREHRLDGNTTVVIKQKEIFSKLGSFKNQELIKFMYYVADETAGISNILRFLKGLVDSFDSIIKKLLEIKISDEEVEKFKNLTNFYICKQKCPCCDRICGEDDPHHKYHQCKYGHQMRAIGGVKLSDGSASVSRCEDIGTNDIVHYNGIEKTWMEFKEEMKNHPNNPWIYDDLERTKYDVEMSDRFKYVWVQVGKRICEDRHKKDMKYVEYNQGNIKNQKIILAPSKCYIFIIDSSSSMRGSKWRDLLAALKINLGVVHTQNNDNKVTIINFSTEVLVEYCNVRADKINVAALTFQGKHTNFEDALQTGLEVMQMYSEENHSMIFLSDGNGKFPLNAIEMIKKHISKLPADKFEFTGLEYQSKSETITRMCQELNGKKEFVADGTKLKSAFYEIITKKI